MLYALRKDILYPCGAVFVVKSDKMCDNSYESQRRVLSGIPCVYSAISISLSVRCIAAAYLDSAAAKEILLTDMYTCRISCQLPPYLYISLLQGSNEKKCNVHSLVQ